MVELFTNLPKGECMNNHNEEDWPIISDDYEPLVGGGSSGNEFAGA